MNPINVARGLDVRRAIVAVARLALAEGAPFPTIRLVSRAIGICAEQCRRHVCRMVREGTLVLRRAGRRRYVQEIRL